MNEHNYDRVAQSYYRLLNSIDWYDEVLLIGLKEGLNKFLSNAFLSLNSTSKYCQGDFYSKQAYKKVQQKDFTNLVYEHMVPKNKYIQKVCEENAKNETLTLEIILELLKKYWKIAIITKDEDKLLLTKSMPKTWNENNIFLRYQEANIQLIMNPMLDNEILWNKMVAQLDNDNNAGLLENTNGMFGKLESIDNGVRIKTDKKTYIYSSDQNLRDILLDGWILG